MPVCFPILRLPHLAAVGVFKYIDLNRQFHLAYNSSRAANIVRSCHYKTETFLNLNLFSCFAIELRETVDGEEVPSFKYQMYPSFEALESHIAILAKAFIPKHATITLSETSTSIKFVKSIFRVLKGSGIKISKLVINCEYLTPKAFHYILEMSRGKVKNLEFSNFDLEQIQWKLKGVKPYDFDSILFRKVDFIKVKHLTALFMTCKKLVVDQCMLEVEDMTQLLNAWINGSTLNYFKIYFQWGFSQFPLVMNGVKNTEVLRARIEDVEDVEWVEFGEQQAFKISQRGTDRDALVYTEGSGPFYIVLTTSFSE